MWESDNVIQYDLAEMQKAQLGSDSWEFEIYDLDIQWLSEAAEDLGCFLVAGIIWRQ